jgi:hypothetical protein
MRSLTVRHDRRHEAITARLSAENDRNLARSAAWAGWRIPHTPNNYTAPAKGHAPDAEARAVEARAAILQLWQHRSDWPVGWPPPRAAHMARILEKLPESSIPPWQPATPLARLHELRHTLLALLVGIVTSDGDDMEQGWLKAFGGLLTPDETAMLTLAATAEQRMSRHFSWQAPAEHEPDTEGDGHVGDTAPARERTPQQAQVSTSLTAQMLLRIQRSLRLRMLLSSLHGCRIRARL